MNGLAYRSSKTLIADLDDMGSAGYPQLHCIPATIYIFCTRASLILIYTNWLKLTINTDAYIFEYIEQEIRKCGTAGLLQALTKLCWEKFH